ncbi:MAG TPA: aminotransferase class I/II-fold pyridoxal phosphate-dependent enzyme, partial [Aquirhabdus sp.]
MTLAVFNLSEQLAALQDQSLKRTPRALSHGVTPLTWRGGKEFLNFSSNDYLGLASHYALRDAVSETLNQHGIGAGAAHLITGHTDLHERLEQRLAQVSGYPRALLFSTGYMANVGVLDALLTPKSTIYQDKLNHASLIDGARISGATHRRYPHQDLATLERWFEVDQSELKLIATDQVFSMDGTEANLPELRSLAEKYQAALMIDDAHGFSVR